MSGLGYMGGLSEREAAAMDAAADRRDEAARLAASLPPATFEVEEYSLNACHRWMVVKRMGRGFPKQYVGVWPTKAQAEHDCESHRKLEALK